MVTQTEKPHWSQSLQIDFKLRVQALLTLCNKKFDKITFYTLHVLHVVEFKWKLKCDVILSCTLTCYSRHCGLCQKGRLTSVMCLKGQSHHCKWKLGWSMEYRNTLFIDLQRCGRFSAFIHLGRTTAETTKQQQVKPVTSLAQLSHLRSMKVYNRRLGQISHIFWEITWSYKYFNYFVMLFLSMKTVWYLEQIHSDRALCLSLWQMVRINKILVIAGV